MGMVVSACITGTTGSEGETRPPRLDFQFGINRPTLFPVAPAGSARLGSPYGNRLSYPARKGPGSQGAALPQRRWTLQLEALEAGTWISLYKDGDKEWRSLLQPTQVRQAWEVEPYCTGRFGF